MTTKPPVIFDAVVIMVGFLAQIMIVRVVTGSYPPLWAWLGAGVAAGVAWAIGRSAALRRNRR